MTSPRGLHPLIEERLVIEAIAGAIGLRPIELRQFPAKPPRVVYEAVFDDHTTLFFKAEVTLPGFNHEIALETWSMEQAARVGVPVPTVLVNDNSESRFPFRYLLMSTIEGVPLSEGVLDPRTERNTLGSAGELLAALHTIRVPGYGRLDEDAYLKTGEVRGQSNDWHESTVLAGIETLKQLARHEIIARHDIDRLKLLLLSRPPEADVDGRLMHGDFDVSHVFVDPATGDITGIIDFGDRGAGPRAWEFATVELWEASRLDDLLLGYEPAAGQTLDRDLIRLYALIDLLQILQRRLNRQDLADARRTAPDLARF